PLGPVNRDPRPCRASRLREDRGLSGSPRRPEEHPMSHRSIDPVDTIWLNMDRDNNLMVIESLMTFDGPVDWERYLAVFEHRVVERFPVFRQRPVWSGMPFATPRWHDDTDFDLGRHVRFVTLDAPGDDAALQDYISSHVCRPLHRDRPLW